MSRIDAFSAYLKANGKSLNTIKGYILDLNQYFKWFEESFDQECVALYRQNVLDYVNFLKNIKLNNAKTINHKLSSLRSYNDFLIASGIQNDVVIQKTDMVKFQTEYASPTQVTELEVKQFMQKVLESKTSEIMQLSPSWPIRECEFPKPSPSDWEILIYRLVNVSSGTEKVKSKEPSL